MNIAVPISLWCTLAFGPLVGVPVAPFYIAAGGVWGAQALLWVALALAVDFVLAYKIAHLLKGPILKRIEKYKLPMADEIGPAKLTLVLRFTPGVPLWVQNYLLGISGVPWGVYLWLSLAAQLVWAAGFMWMGDAWAKGQWFFVAAALGLVILLALVTKVYAKRAAKQR
jgi:uncharacterized membrane protein YdjX (TVP38/TMEM64 family)